MRIWINAVLLGLSLCADCFAVSLCSAVTLDPGQLRKRGGWIALAFAVIQAGLLVAGWGAGRVATDLVASHVAHFERVAHILGFLLLLYVGGEMFLDGVQSKSERMNLTGFRNVLLGGIATSIDAAAVGLSMALDASGWDAVAPIALSVFVFTFLSVVAGLFSGSLAGRKLGHSARIIGGLVLIGLGINILL